MLNAIEAITGHRFRDEGLLREALTHSSSADTRLVSNERMEFLGDSILGTVVCEHLYHTYPDLMEGDLTKIKSAVVSRRVCAKVSKATGLDRLLSLGKGMAGRPTIPASVAAAAVESIVAALYLDAGIEPTRRFILEQMHPYIEEAAASAHQQNYKSVLQQLAQRHLPFVPAYVLLDSKGPDHAKAFEVCVEINGQRFAAAWAHSKKEAEQQAALNALLGLGLAERDGSGAVRIDDGNAPPAAVVELVEAVDAEQ